MIRRITFISDTHNQHKHLTSEDMGNMLGGGDILIHSGDITSRGKNSEIINFLNWFSKTDFKYKIFIAGNHDFGFQEGFKVSQEYKDNGVIYLEDSEIIIDGIKIYGSPWQPEFHNWAFNLPRGEKLSEKWKMIPDDTDILVTHSPAYSILDYVPYGSNVGCEELYKRVFEVKPKIHSCGHIHESHGQKTIDGIDFINSSILDDSYLPSYSPIKVNFNIGTKEFDYE